MNWIELENVSKAFDGVPVLKDVSLTLAEGDTVALTGRSGIGKTTLLRILMGLEAPDSGAVRGADGMRFSAVFQEDRLLEHLCAVENVRFVLGAAGKGSAEADTESIRTALASVGLTAGDAEKPVRALSGGQRRRVALVRALLAPSDILLLDEPFTGLDDAARALCIDAIRALRGHRAVVLVTHDPNDLARLAAREARLS